MSENEMVVRNFTVGAVAAVLLVGSLIWGVVFYNVHFDSVRLGIETVQRDAQITAIKAGYVMRVLPGSAVPVWTKDEREVAAR